MRRTSLANNTATDEPTLFKAWL